MDILGKCPPEPTELRRISEAGFESVELYLTPEHLDHYQDTVEACRSAAVDVEAVHTPHVSLDRAAYLRESNELAVDLGASVVCVHSARLPLINLPDHIDVVDYTVKHGFENNTGDSPYHLEQAVLDRGESLVLDTAHLYTAVEDDRYVREFERLVRDYSDEIALVHFCDSTPTRDGLPFGEGDLPMAAVGEILKREYDGPVTLEVMPEYQADARKRFETY